MKRTLIVLLVAAYLISAGIAIAGQALPEDGPSVYLPVRNHNFEPVLEGTEVVYAFVVRNQGNQPLQIEKVRTG